MAKLVVSILTTLDGYCAGPGGALDGMPMDAAFSAHNLDLMRDAGTLLFGARTLPLFEAYWPKVDRGPETDPVEREIAERVEGARKVVVSDNLAVSPASPWVETEVVPRAKSHARIAELASVAGPDILIFGSHVLASGLLAAGLVDELHLLVGNVLIGAGVPSFEPGLAQEWQLLAQRRLMGSDTVALRYDCRAR